MTVRLSGLYAAPVLIATLGSLVGLLVCLVSPWVSVGLVASGVGAVFIVVALGGLQSANLVRGHARAQQPQQRPVEERLLLSMLLLFCLIVSARSLTAGISLFILPIVLYVLLISQQRRLDEKPFDPLLIFIAFFLALSVLSWLLGTFDTDTLRPANLATYSVVLCTVIAFWLLLEQTKLNLSTPEMLVVLIDGVGVYLIANVVLYFVLDVRSPAEAMRATGGSALSLFDSRLVFPLTNSLNIPPLLAAAYVTALPCLWKTIHISEKDSLRRLFRLTALAASIVIILGAGSRVPAITAVSLFLVSRLAPSAFVRLAIPLTLAALFVPLWWSSAQWLVSPPASLLRDASPFFARSAANDQSTLAGRTEVWREVSDAATSSSPLRLFLGYGAHGHVPSGMIKDSAYLFDILDDPSTASVHNSILQQLVDTGVVGAAALVAIVIGTMAGMATRFRNAVEGDERQVALAGIAFLTVLSVGASTDRLLSSDSPAEPFWLMIMLALLVRRWCLAGDGATRHLSTAGLVSAESRARGERARKPAHPSMMKS